MKANELRIGNMIYFPYLIENVLYEADTITGLYQNSITVKSRPYTALTYDSIKPLKITKELLNRFGIEEYDRMGDIKFLAFRNPELFDFNFMLCDGVLKVSFYQLDWKRAFEIKYIHQLQNLYFALTGQEL